MLVTAAVGVGAAPATAGGCKNDALYPLFGGNTPYAYITSVSSGTTSATVTAAITPQDLSVGYRIEYDSQGSGTGPYKFSTPETALGQCQGTATVQIPLTGLQPGTGYRLRIVLSSVAGAFANVGESFGTGVVIPSGPPYKLRLSVSKHALQINAGVTFKGRLGIVGTLPSDYTVNLELRHGRRWGSIDLTYPDAHGAVSFPNPTTLDRNSTFRLASAATGAPVKRPAAHSKPVTVYVYPILQVTAQRGQGNQVAARFLAQVHIGAHYRHQRVYFYIRPQGSKRLTLVASARLRGSLGELDAAVVFHVSGAGIVLACTRHQLVSDMGKPYTLRSCGQPTVNP